MLKGASTVGITWGMPCLGFPQHDCSEDKRISKVRQAKELKLKSCILRNALPCLWYQGLYAPKTPVVTHEESASRQVIACLTKVLRMSNLRTYIDGVRI